uniref:Uncharacterized protein n=1 Tax=Mus musculus TaxID=10090 RepID=Q8BGQ9_MOUSE|nr:unnamed protein product [Mus musculus]BAC32593.1 unnamed protein product [Mus musculus]
MISLNRNIQPSTNVYSKKSVYSCKFLIMFNWTRILPSHCCCHTSLANTRMYWTRIEADMFFFLVFRCCQIKKAVSIRETQFPNIFVDRRLICFLFCFVLFFFKTGFV